MLNEILNRKYSILSSELNSFYREIMREAKKEGVKVDFDYTPDCLVGSLQVRAGKAIYDYQVIF